jgi:hypothetical protein
LSDYSQCGNLANALAGVSSAPRQQTPLERAQCRDRDAQCLANDLHAYRQTVLQRIYAAKAELAEIDKYAKLLPAVAPKGKPA